MALAAGLSGVPLVATWAGVQWAPAWADKLTGGKMPGFAAKLLSGSDEAALPLPTPQGEVKVHALPERSPAKGVKRYTVGILAGCVMRVLSLAGR